MQGGVKRTVTCKCSFLEIYNETLTDLLSPLEGQHLQIREDASHGIYVENLCEEAVGSSERQHATRLRISHAAQARRYCCACNAYAVCEQACTAP
jgi:hypothetical protein